MNNRIFPKLNARQTKSAVLSIRKGEDNNPHGVINTIMDVLQVAKKQHTGVTTGQIAEVLAGMFPDRDGDGMKTTVRVQLSRLPKERKFKIVKERDGRNVRYRAA